MTRILPAFVLATTLAAATRAEDAAGTLARLAAFGTSDGSILNIPAAAFVPRGSNVAWAYASPGYIYQTSAVAEPFWAPVDLPTGAVILGLGLYFDDTDADHDLTATLRVYRGGTNNNAFFENVASVASFMDLGQRYTFDQIPGHTVDNDTLDGLGMYAVVIQTPAGGAALAFKGVEILWYRQVSPAPAQATFGDVPADHLFFQFVEALAASGITAGCGNGNYCPDEPLTRGQMAVFLAKALGLHWADQ